MQEFRLISNNADSPWQWTVGAYYKDDESQGGHHKGCYNGGSPAYDTINTHCWMQSGFFDGWSIDVQGEIIEWRYGLVTWTT